MYQEATYLELTLIKDVDELLRNQFAKSRHERVELFFDTARDTVFNDRAGKSVTGQRNQKVTEAQRALRTRHIPSCSPR